MVLRHGKFGRFLSCSAYPACSNIKNIDDKGNVIDRPVSEAGQELDRACPKCGGKLAVKASRWGTKFIGCTSYPKCDYTSELQTQCPKCGTELVKKRLANRRVILVCKRNDDTKGADCDFVLWGKPLLEHCARVQLVPGREQGARQRHLAPLLQQPGVRQPPRPGRRDRRKQRGKRRGRTHDLAPRAATRCMPLRDLRLALQF